MSDTPSRYNIRVYGLLHNAHGEVLVTDELRNGYPMTKFPGGGHEFGEGLAETLIREWREEMDRAVEVGELFYINDFLQISAFDPQDQLLSVYFHVRDVDPAPMLTTKVGYDWPADARNAQTFRWVNIAELHVEDFTFPVDRAVVERYKRWFLGR